jgi:predicted amino acid racemase
VALGHQDTDPSGITPKSSQIKVLGASSDHVVLDDEGYSLLVGSEVSFDLNYSALIRSMASPFVKNVFKNFMD